MVKVKIYILRFLILYFVLYVFPFPLNYIPFGIGDALGSWVASFWQFIIKGVAEFVFNYKEELSFNGRGSGDTMFDYMLVVVRILISLVLLIIWGLRFGKDKSDILAREYIVVLLRYFLAFSMFTYGLSKIFYLQFPELSLINLTRSYGDSSPMGLLWKFMGYSEAYSIFTGSMEVLGGLLLLFRNTKLLGAMLTLGIMINVFVLNMTFDVPVKLFSFHLCAMLMVIILPDLRNLYRFLVLNQPTRPNYTGPYFSAKKRQMMGYAFKGFLIFYVLFTSINAKIQSQQLYGKRAPQGELYGIYDINTFVIDSDTIAPLTTDKRRWKQLIIDKKSSLLIKMDDSRIGMRHAIDSAGRILKLTPFLEGYQAFELKFDLEGKELSLTTYKNTDTLKVNATKRGREDFFLINRGFHFINEYPMQR